MSTTESIAINEDQVRTNGTFEERNELIDALIAQRDKLVVESDELTSRALNAESRCTNLQTTVSSFRFDVAVIGEFLIEKAEEYGYCDTFDSCIDELNSRLRVSELPTREKNYVVTFTVTLRPDQKDDFESNLDNWVHQNADNFNGCSIEEEY